MKMVKTELATYKSRLSEESQARLNLETEVGRLREDLLRTTGDTDEKCSALEREAAETKRLMLESQQNSKELLASQQDAYQRLSAESTRLNRSLQVKETEYRELELLERSMESQLSRALITIQKMDRKARLPKSGSGMQTASQMRQRRASHIFHGMITEQCDDSKSPKATFNILDIKSLYSADVDEGPASLITHLESLEDVCTLPDDN